MGNVPEESREGKRVLPPILPNLKGYKEKNKVDG